MYATKKRNSKRIGWQFYIRARSKRKREKIEEAQKRKKFQSMMVIWSTLGIHQITRSWRRISNQQRFSARVAPDHKFGSLSHQSENFQVYLVCSFSNICFLQVKHLLESLVDFQCNQKTALLTCNAVLYMIWQSQSARCICVRIDFSAHSLTGQVSARENPANYLW